MAIFAIADLHLSFGTPNKKMDVFGPTWENHHEKIASCWKKLIKEDDLILIAGDISWATHTKDAIPDLNWIENLPGTKVIIRGNHDYWWSSIKKLKEVLPPSIHAIHNNTFLWNEIAISGARLWDTPEYSFSPFIEFIDNPLEKKSEKKPEEIAKENEKIFLRELNRLKISLQEIPQTAKKRIVMTHYPPLSASLENSRVTNILESHKIDLCVFGHLHNVRKGSLPFGTKNGIQYHLTSCDYLGFKPIKVCD